MNDLIEQETAATIKPKRKYKVTPTPRQYRAARIMADIAMGKRKDIKSQGDIIIAAGYSPATKESPKTLLNTNGVHTALNEMGFNENTAKKVVYSILTNEKAAHKDRLKASDMVFKVHGTYAAEKHVNVNVEIDSQNERLIELAERLRNGQK
jgi:Holliday junction resolvasome RuvABC DNA-binding subunit